MPQVFCPRYDSGASHKYARETESSVSWKVGYQRRLGTRPPGSSGAKYLRHVKVLIVPEEYEILRYQVIATWGWVIAMDAVVACHYVATACFYSPTFRLFPNDKELPWTGAIKHLVSPLTPNCFFLWETRAPP